jgi:hypothetical protein
LTATETGYGQRLKMSGLVGVAAMRAGTRGEEVGRGENETAAQMEHRNPLKQTQG